MSEYFWKSYGNPSNPKIAIIATSSGYKNKLLDTLETRLEKLHKMGFCVYVPQYEDGSIIMEPSQKPVKSEEKRKSAISDEIYQKAVSPETATRQVLDAVKNGWNILSLMGGNGFEDKVEMMDKAFLNLKDKPAKPIKIFGFSDVSYATYLQSHHPDIVRFHATPVSYFLSRGHLLPNDVEHLSEDDKELYSTQYHEKLEQFVKTLKGEDHEYKDRKYLGDHKIESSFTKVQYYPLHADLIIADGYAKEEKHHETPIIKGTLKDRLANKGKNVPKLKTIHPYIIGFEGFMQHPQDFWVYDHDLASDIERFLRERKAKEELPLAIEIGSFVTRVDGGRGYGLTELMNKETGLIEINDFNIDRLFKNKKKMQNLQDNLQKIVNFDESEKEPEFHLTSIDPELKTKIKANINLDREDVKKLLQHENKKILEKQKQIIVICNKYKVPVVANFQYGHTVNMQVIGGGIINVKTIESHLKFKQVSNDIKLEEPLTKPETSPLSQSYAKPTISSILKSKHPEESEEHSSRFSRALRQAEERRKRDEDLYHLSR